MAVVHISLLIVEIQRIRMNKKLREVEFKNKEIEKKSL